MDFACFAVLTAIAMAGMVIFVYREGWLIDSDLASELMLSFKLHEEGGILSHNWIYSTELRVFETQWFYRIGALLFPHNWSRARLVALMLMMPVMGFSSYLFAKSAGFGRFAKLFSFFLLMPIGHGYFFYTIWGLYYQPYFIFIYLTLACLFASYQRMEKGGTPVFLTAAASVLALMSGCNGFRQMQVQYLPLLVAAFVLLAVDTRKHAHSVKELPVKCRKTFFTFLLAFDLCVFNFIGILINRFLSSQYTFRTFNDIRLLEGHERSYASLFWDYLSLFGYQGNLSLFTADGIGSVFGIVLAFCVVFSAVRIGWKDSSRSFTSQFCFVLFCSELAVNLTVFRFLDYYSYHHQLPMLPLGIALIVLELKEEPTVLRATRPLAVACVTLMLIICSAVAVDYEVKNPTWADRDREELAEWMVDSGIHQAAASFLLEIPRPDPGFSYK